jgi:hypothetical protein
MDFLRSISCALAIAASASVDAAELTLGRESPAELRVEWLQAIASPGDDWINDLVPLRNGNVLGVGFLNRDDAGFAADWLAVAAELEPGGTMVSQYRYGEHGGSDAFWSVAEAQDGRRIFGGFTTRIGPGGINGYVLVSRPDGVIVKENAFGGGGYDRFTDLAPAGDGYVFLGHSQPADADRRRVYLVKTDAAGLPLWERIHDAPQTWGALYIEPAADGGYIIAGGTSDGVDGDMFAMKVDRDGQEVWRKRVGTPDWNEINHGLLVRPDGKIVLVGYTHPRGGHVNDLVAATLGADGEVERLERFGGTGDDRAILAKADSSGTIWVVGQTASAGAGGSDLLLTSLDSSGAFTGSAVTLGGPADDNGTAVLPLGTDAILVAGYSRNLGPGRQDAFIARLTRPRGGRAHPAFRRTIVKQP